MRPVQVDRKFCGLLVPTKLVVDPLSAGDGSVACPVQPLAPISA